MIDWTLWIAIIVFQIINALLSLKKSIRTSFPSFSQYLCFVSLRSVLLLAIALYFRDQATYQRALTVFSVLSATMAAIVGLEIWRKVFGPALGLPRGTVSKFLAAFVIIYISCLAFALCFGAHTQRKYLDIVLQFDTVAMSITALTMGAMIVYSFRLRIPWRNSLARICAGFVLYFGVNSVTGFLLGQLGVSALYLQRVSQAVYMVSMALWAWSMCQREPAVLPLTREEVAVMKMYHEETMQAIQQYAMSSKKSL